jgi:hypothetical protein
LIDGDEIWAWVGNRLRHGVYNVLGEYEYAEGFTGMASLFSKEGVFIATLDYEFIDVVTSKPFSSRESALAARAGKAVE